MRGKPAANEIKIIKAVMANNFELNNATEASYFMLEIVKIAFNGWFAGPRAYNNFNAGSWLGEKLCEYIIRAEKISFTSFTEVLIAYGLNKTLNEWEYVVDSYLLPGVPYYKSLSLPELPPNAPDIWKKAYDKKHREWWPKAHNGQQKTE